ncbi:Aldo/keto reductase [Aaosphaeria arxii CBS 175.79]|uniref:Aldo/keto reductase n=1 Tax=Aaosphaeria arxii CBS 175.79 TaxID=1450172 RepID=A0A6A5XCH3_9PLEO|nr:Aldo/keto reductase [Aaosphaeria arxii CBS 175.79]KAF2010474.1 Aldo/keto reductase [Aaosphaeria arxii CBS 175.79]
MSFFEGPPKPKTALGWHRVLSPSANIKVSPIVFGGISLGNEWSELFGESQDPSALLDAYFSLGGNFVDTANHYNAGESERHLGEWMEKRGVRDQMVIATKYGGGLRMHDRESEPLQSNFTGPGAKSLRLSVKESLQKLRTDYIDILYLHWWDVSASVEEVMRNLHALVLAGKVLYLGISDTPAWVVVKANEFARRNGLTPFSVYQGRWSVAFRDMEAEIVPMCEDQGMGIVTWGSVAGGQLMTAEERRKRDEDPNAPKSYYPTTESDIRICNVLERLAKEKNTTLRSVALAYLFHQSTYVFPIVGVLTVEHVKAFPDALSIKLSNEEIDEIHNAAPFNPLFPMTFLFGETGYNLRKTVADQVHYKMSTWIDAPPKPLPYQPRS